VSVDYCSGGCLADYLEVGNRVQLLGANAVVINELKSVFLNYYNFFVKIIFC